MKSLDIICATGATTSVLTVTLQSVVSIVSGVVAITAGIITIILKLKKYYSDKHLSDEEQEDLLNELEKVQDNIDQLKNHKH